MKEGFWAKVCGVTALIGLFITLYSLFHNSHSPAPGTIEQPDKPTVTSQTPLPVTTAKIFKGYFKDKADLNDDGVNELLYKQCPKESYNSCHVYVYEKRGESWEEIGDLIGDIVGYPIAAKAGGYDETKTNGYRDISIRDSRWEIHDETRKPDHLYKWNGSTYVEVESN
jgi:hypothetical protein